MVLKEVKTVNKWKKKARSLNNKLQTLISVQFLHNLPRFLSVVLVLTTLISTLRISANGLKFLRGASQGELLRLCQMTSPDAPVTEGKAVAEREDDLGNKMGYEVELSGLYDIGSVETRDEVKVYPLIDTPKNGFYSLLYGGEDANKYRTVTEQYEKELLHWNPITGLRRGFRNRVVRLTLADSVQTNIYRYMQENGLDGSCCAYDPATGELYCLVSCQATRDIYRINEGLCTARPASTFKLVLGCLLAEQGVDISHLRYSCQGSCKLSDGSVVRCAGGAAHGEQLTLSDALGLSCNCWFAQAMEEHLGWEQTADHLQKLGFRVNGEGGISTLGRLERDPSTITLEDGELFSNIWSMLGEGKNQACPLEMIQLYAAVAREGRAATPVLVQGEDSEVVQYFSPETAKTVYKQWKNGYEKHYDRKKYGKLISVAKTGTDQLDRTGNEAFTLAGYSEKLECAFYIRINNAVTQNGKKRAKKMPLDVANELLEAIQTQKEAEQHGES